MIHDRPIPELAHLMHLVRTTILITCLSHPAFASAAQSLAADPALARHCVILLHGLGRTSFSMQKMADTFADAGYTVSNVHYDSRDFLIEQLSEMAISEGLAECRQAGASKIHFATHSLGGILVRYYLDQHTIGELGRVVMLAPPNHGSEVIDVFGRVPGFFALSGEPAHQLGTNGPDSIPIALPPVNFELGVIAGTRSFSPLFSMALPERDDGKVTVESTRIEGMSDFIEMPYTHTFIMQRTAVIEQARHFIEHGSFDHPPEM